MVSTMSRQPASPLVAASSTHFKSTFRHPCHVHFPNSVISTLDRRPTTVLLGLGLALFSSSLYSGLFPPAPSCHPPPITPFQFAVSPRPSPELTTSSQGVHWTERQEGALWPKASLSPLLVQSPRLRNPCGLCPPGVSFLPHEGW